MGRYFVVGVIFFIPFLVFADTPTRVGTDTYHEQTSSSDTWTISHTVPSSGQNQAIWVVVQLGTTVNPTSVTWNGDNLSLELDLDAGVQAVGTTVWYLAAPDETSANVVVNWASGYAGIAMIFTTQDTAQSSPIDVSDINSVVGGVGSLSVTLTTATANDLIFSLLGGLAPDATITFTGSQTEITQGTNRRYGFGYEVAGATGDYIHSWTWDVLYSADAPIFGILYEAPSGGGGLSDYSTTTPVLGQTDFILVSYLSVISMISLCLLGLKVITIIWK